jgi:hypothetical protein
MRIVVEVPQNENSKNFKVLKHVDFKVNVQDYCLNFYDSKSKIPTRIQTFGIKGTGKSLWIATLYSMLNDGDKFHIPMEQGLRSRDSPNDVTREIVEVIPKNKYVQTFRPPYTAELIFDECNRPLHWENHGKPEDAGSRVTFKDAPGIDMSPASFDENTNEHKRYSDDHIRYLVHGALPTGFKLEGDELNCQFTNLTRNIDRDYIENLDKHMIKQRPHIVVFCLSPNSLEDPATANRIRIMLDKFTQEGVPLIVCLTQMDKVDPNLETNPLLSSEGVDKMLEDSAKQLGINVDNIIYSVSYGRTPEGNKVFEYDKLHFKNLEKIQRIAEQYAMKLREEGNELTGNAMVASKKFRNEYEN